MPSDPHAQDPQPEAAVTPEVTPEVNPEVTPQEGPPSAALSQEEGGPHGPAVDAAALLSEREDQLIRLAAEIDNLRKRHAQELTNASKFAIEGFAEAMLPVADSLEMALSLQGQTLEGLTSGVELTLRQLVQAFERGRLVSLSPAGEKFDPNRHQAVSMVDGGQSSQPVASGHVVAVLQKGYLIGDRVLRQALVAVAS